MSDVVNDLSSTHVIIRAVEENMISFWMGYGRLEGREVFEDERAQRYLTGMPHPLFNGIFRAQLTSNQIEPTIREITEVASQRKVPLFWWVGPTTLPSDLGNHLLKQGWHDAGNAPGMAINLNALPKSLPTPEEFHVEIVDNLTKLRQWVEVLILGNEMPPFFNQPLYELEASRGFDSSTPRRYLGFLNGEPVAASALHLDVGVAGIYAVATIPKARGQGIGGAVTLQPLLDARASGYRVGILQASSMGYRVYKRLGFKVFWQFELYYFQPK